MVGSGANRFKSTDVIELIVLIRLTASAPPDIAAAASRLFRALNATRDFALTNERVGQRVFVPCLYRETGHIANEIQFLIPTSGFTTVVVDPGLAGCSDRCHFDVRVLSTKSLCVAKIGGGVDEDGGLAAAH